MARYNDQGDLRDSDLRRGQYGNERSEDRRHGPGRAATGGRDYSTSGRYTDRENDYDSGSPYPDRERDYNMGGYGGGRRQSDFYMKGEYTGRGPEGGGFGYAPSDDYERGGYGRYDGTPARGDENRGWSDQDYDSDRYNWNGGGGVQRNRDNEGGRWIDRDYYEERGKQRSSPAGEFGYLEGWSAEGPHTGRGPKGYEPSTDRTRERVCERLFHHGHLDASQLEVQVENGEVTLTGTVDSRRAKRLAEDLAESVPGVQDVHNQLRVNRDSGGGGNGDQRSAEAAKGQSNGNSGGSSRRAAQT